MKIFSDIQEVHKRVITLPEVVKVILLSKSCFDRIIVPLECLNYRVEIGSVDLEGKINEG